MEKQILGATETIIINNHPIPAKIDTGADKSSISLELTKKLNLIHGLLSIRKVKSSNGEQYRPVIIAKAKIKGKTMKIRFNVTKRKDLKYKAIIGKNVLKRNFLVDVTQ